MHNKRTSYFLNAMFMAGFVFFGVNTSHAADTYRVVRVLDGDTIEILVNARPARIRLADIDAPEKKQPFGQRSRQFLTSLVGGKEVSLSGDKHDRYGRILGRVFVKGRDNECMKYMEKTDLCTRAYYVNEEMVKAGLAWAYRYKGKVTSPNMEHLEIEARAERRGLWSAPAIEPWRWRQSTKG